MNLNEDPFLNLRSIEDLCELLKFETANFSSLIDHSQDSYRVFSIPKKRGGERLIESPSRDLKYLQRLLNEHLQRIYNRARPANVHGFLSNFNKTAITRSIVTNASEHVGAEQLLNLDLNNFFHSVGVMRVKEIFMAYPFYFGNDLASYLAILTTYKERLPMGAPTSPVLSNFACFMLDRKLARLAESYQLRYTRYADDLTFSGEAIKAQHLLEIREIIQSEDFIVNDAKTRVQGNKGSQMVTGLKVNEQVNVDRKFVRSIRAMLNNWRSQSIYKAAERNKSPAHFLNILSGKLNFLKMVKGRHDPIFKKLNEQFEDLYFKYKLMEC